MKYEFNSSTTEHAVTIAANSTLYSTCSSLSVFPIVCGESFPANNYAGKTKIDLAAGSYVFKTPSPCEDCWICIEPKILDSTFPVDDESTADYEAITVCDANTETLWVQLIKIEDGVSSILQDWADTQRKCNPVAEAVCDPRITEVFGSTNASAEFTAIAVNNPSCCEVRVVTSAGEFTVKPNEHGVQDSFDCVVTLQSIEVSGDNCDPSTVHTILTKRF